MSANIWRGQVRRGSVVVTLAGLIGLTEPEASANHRRPVRSRVSDVLWALLFAFAGPLGVILYSMIHKTWPGWRHRPMWIGLAIFGTIGVMRALITW